MIVQSYELRDRDVVIAVQGFDDSLEGCEVLAAVVLVEMLAGHRPHDGNCISLRGNERIRERLAKRLNTDL